MKHLKINIPEGYKIDKDLSTFENIVFKKIEGQLSKTWEDLDKIEGYYTDQDSEIFKVDHRRACSTNTNVFATKEQAEASIALAQLSQLMKVYNNGWAPDWTDNIMKSTIEYCKDNPTIESRCSYTAFLAFEKEETAKLFLENFKDLILTAKPLL